MQWTSYKAWMLALDEIKWKERTRVAIRCILFYMKREFIVQETQDSNYKQIPAVLSYVNIAVRIDFSIFFQNFICVLFVVKFFENWNFVNVSSQCF